MAGHSVVALTGGRNVQLLAEQAKTLHAELAVTCHEECYSALKEALAGTNIEVAAGQAALLDAADRPADWIMSAIVGSAGLAPGFRALQHGTTLALANKESLVTAGPLLMSEAKRYGATILPVDSEHSAVFQALTGEQPKAVEKVTITSSGGAFRDWPLEKLASATVAEASNHPNFNMGQRITIDSASMFNKSLEIVEAKEFFGLKPDQVEVIIQREQIIHALVAFCDGAVMAHMGMPDMRHAIGYALHWPERGYVPVDRLNLSALGQLSFAAPDPRRYPALSLAQEVMRLGGLSGAVFNAAKEAALDGFIAGKVGFTQMAQVVEATLDALSSASDFGKTPKALEDVLRMDHLARTHAKQSIEAQTVRV